MKKDWTYKKLGEFCDILNGYAFKSNKYVDKGIRVIRIANVQKGIIVDDQLAFYPLSTQSEIDKYILNEGDILMSLTGNVGRVGILQKEMLPAALNQRVACLRMSDNSLYSKFFFHYLNSDLFEKKCIASARGIAQLNMSTEWLKEQFIPIPPLSTQRSIVAELDLLHSVISKKKEQLRELDNLAQSLFYQMFGDPITNPMGWEVKKLGEVAEAITGITYKPTDVAESGTIVLRSGNIQNGEIDLNDIVRVQRPISDKYFVQEGDILMCSRNGSFRLVGKAAKIPAMSEKMTWGAFMTIIRSEINPYILAFLRTPAFRAQLTSAKTTTVNQITIGMLSKIPLPLPPLSLQQSFAAKVSAIEAQKQAITQSIQHTEALLAQRMDNYFGI